MASLLLLLLLLAAGGCAAAQAAVTTSDAVLLLEKIKPALQGGAAADNLQLSSWNATVPLCQWRGLAWTSGGAAVPCTTSAALRANLSLYSDPTIQLLSIHLPAAALAGALPAELSLLSSLSSLLLPVNSLSGSLPLDLFNAPALSDLDLSDNRFTGRLPDSLWNLCGTAVSLRLHGNRLSGSIPNPAVLNPNCSSLTMIDFSSNQLVGEFPAFIAGFTEVQDVDLSSNGLDGVIPESILKLTHLRSLNLSYNNFSGELPSSSSKFGAEAFQANPGLCGGALGGCGSAGKSGLSSGAVAGLVIGLMAGAVVVASLSIGWVQGRKRRNRSRGVEDEMEMEDSEIDGGADGKLVVFQGGEHLTLDDVLNATGQVLEKTSYGTVYKAKLADGATIALRLLREGSCRDPGSCLPVVRQLGRARHEHLVPLRGFYHGRRGEQLLIYDYFPNRTLHDLLHETRAGRPVLNWSRRHKIALGIARGLAYLHTGQEAPITHGNVRSSNVIIDEFFVARLTEYGLDKLMVPAVADEMVSAAKLDGYKAPELQKMKKCSTRTDVYAFGIVLLEILMGRRPGKGAADLPAMVKVAVLEETTMDVFDVEALRGVRSPTEEGLVQALRLAMGCCAPVATVRPDMAEVVRQLEENRPRNRSALYSPAESRSGIGTPL